MPDMKIFPVVWHLQPRAEYIIKNIFEDTVHSRKNGFSNYNIILFFSSKVYIMLQDTLTICSIPLFPSRVQVALTRYAFAIRYFETVFAFSSISFFFNFFFLFQGDFFTVCNVIDFFPPPEHRLLPQPRKMTKSSIYFDPNFIGTPTTMHTSGLPSLYIACTQ